MSQLVATMLVLGAVYALLGTAVAVTAMATRTLHLAIGEVLIAGVLLQVLAGVELLAEVPRALAVAAALAVGAVLGAALQPLVLRWMPDHTTELVGLAVAAGVLDVLTIRIVGARTYRPVELLTLPDVGQVPGEVVAALLVGGGTAVLLGVAIAKTRWGRRLRLTGASPEAARYHGISPARVRMSALGLSGALAVLAGLLVTPVTFVAAGQGAGFTIRGVAAALLFGRVGPRGAILSGLALGAVEAIAGRAWPSLGSEVAVAAVIVAVLAWRGSEHERAWGRAW